MIQRQGWSSECISLTLSHQGPFPSSAHLLLPARATIGGLINATDAHLKYIKVPRRRKIADKCIFKAKKQSSEELHLARLHLVGRGGGFWIYYHPPHSFDRRPFLRKGWMYTFYNLLTARPSICGLSLAKRRPLLPLIHAS